MIKILTELMCEISEFFAEVFKNWDMENRIRHLFRERSKIMTIHEAKILKICHNEKVGWGEYYRPLRPKVWDVIALLVLWLFGVMFYSIKRSPCETCLNFGSNNGGPPPTRPNLEARHM